MFKKCGCGRTYETLKDFVERTTPVCKNSTGGLALFNCDCGTTIGIYAEIVDSSIDPETLKCDKIACGLRKKLCPSHCTGKCTCEYKCVLSPLYKKKAA